MSCLQTIQDYALRSVGLGERMLPRTDFTLCEQFTLIGSGMIWNIYYGVLALTAGFFLATALGVAKTQSNAFLRKPAEWFILVFRGSPLFIQFFFGYFLFLNLKQINPGLALFSNAWVGALIVLWMNGAAYAGEIFYGALQSVPKGDIEAADAYGLSGWKRFRRIVWPTTLRLAWPSYTNEAIFLFHATTLVFFSGFPSKQQMGDALYYASYFADKTFNPFVPYPILAGYFIVLTLCLTGVSALINRRLNRHVATGDKVKMRFCINVFR